MPRRRVVGRRDAPNVGQPGQFSIIDWTGYPEGAPRPPGPFRLLEGTEYEAARRVANEANRALHKADSTLARKQIHEVKPVKFDGSPTDLANKLFLDRLEHARFTAWWNRLMRELQTKSPPPPPGK